MASRKYNFNPGPATLPVEVLQEVQRNTVEYKKLGMSFLEISHRSAEYTEIHNQAKLLLKELLKLPDNYDVLFLAMGASLQFAMLPMNFLGEDKKADYINTGSWSQKAIKEAKLFGTINIAASSEEDGFRSIPKPEQIKLDPEAAYVHITSNNTIYGTQWHWWPDTGDVPLFCDMSSDFLSRKIDATRFGVIYAGAQKNAGPAGVTIVIINRDLLARCNDNVPTLLSYRTHVEKNSLFNTPPVYAIYVTKLVLQWLKGNGGIEKIEEINRRKGEIIYSVLDEYPDFYRGHARKDSRSLMNVTLRLANEELEKKFLTQAAERNFHGLKGHRSVGGIRISMYNAMPLEGVEKLAEFMREFKART